MRDETENVRIGAPKKAIVIEKLSPGSRVKSSQSIPRSQIRRIPSRDQVS